MSDDLVEAQPLWEYPGKALSDVVELLKLDLNNYNIIDVMEKTYTYHLNRHIFIVILLIFFIISDFYRDGICNGIAFWVDWDLDGNGQNIITTGPIQPIEKGKYIKWYMHIKQGVHLLAEEYDLKNLHCTFQFNSKLGKISFKINK